MTYQRGGVSGTLTGSLHAACGKATVRVEDRFRSQTRLMVEERGLPLDHAYGHGAGWQAHIEDLGSYLAGEQPGDWKTRWTELTPAYLEQAKDLR